MAIPQRTATTGTFFLTPSPTIVAASSLPICRRLAFRNLSPPLRRPKNYPKAAKNDQRSPTSQTSFIFTALVAFPCASTDLPSANCDATGYDSSVMIALLIPTRRFFVSLALLLFTVPALAKDRPLQVIDWPTTGTPVLRFTFAKFKQLNGMSNTRGYVMDTMAANLSPRVISSARFSVYLFDKNKIRVGEDFITLNNVGPSETVKLQFTIMTSGTPVSISIQDTAQTARAVSLTVNSTPQGAMLKVDGTET